MPSINHSLFGLLVGSALPMAALADLPSMTFQGDGADHISARAWKAAFSPANATGTWPIVGYDVTQDWPGDRILGWSLRVNVTADIPSKDEKDRFYSGTSITLLPPNELVDKMKNGTRKISVGEGWHVCGNVIGGLDESEVTRFNGDNGSCRKLLGNKCIEDIKKTITEGSGSGCGGWASSLDSCKELKIWSWEMTMNETTLLSEPIYSRVTDKTHKAGDTKDFEEMVKSTIPMVISWDGTVPTDGNIEGDDSNGVDIEDMVDVVCVRANYTTYGSEVVRLDDEDDGRSAASRATIATFGLVSAALAVAIGF